MIADFFCLGNILGIKDAHGGANTGFLIRTDRGKYFTKIMTGAHVAANTEYEAVFANHLFRHEVPSAPYLVSKDGSCVFKNNGIVSVAQKEIHGVHPAVTLDAVSQVGMIMGKMSLVSLKHLPEKFGWLSREYVKKEIVLLRRDFDHDKHARKIFSALNAHNFFAKNIIPKLPHSIVHADLHTDNVLFRKEKLIAIIDWEDASVAPALFDFASSVIYWCFGDEGFRPKIYKAFYNSYTKERPFTKLEHEYLLDCIQHVAVLQTLWRFLNWENSRRKGALWALELPLTEILKI